VKITGDHQFTYRTFRLVCLEAFPRRRVLQGVGAIGLALVLLTGVESDKAIPIVGLAFCIVMPELFALLSWFPQRQQANQPTQYELDDTGLHVHTATSDVRVTWSGVTWVKTHRHAWMVRNGATQLPIPRAAFSPDDQATFDAFVAARVAVKP
jgi:hypothetical protein